MIGDDSSVPDWAKSLIDVVHQGGTMAAQYGAGKSKKLPAGAAGALSSAAGELEQSAGLRPTAPKPAEKPILPKTSPGGGISTMKALAIAGGVVAGVGVLMLIVNAIRKK
jgi:hypothetical protein